MRPKLPQEDPLVPQVRIIDIDGELFFGAVDFFQATLRAMANREEVKVIILRLKNAHHLDATACFALSQLHSYLQGSGQHLILCGLKPGVWRVLERSGLMKKIGFDNVFASEPEGKVGSTGQAIRRAEELAGHSPQEELKEGDAVPLAPEVQPQS